MAENEVYQIITDQIIESLNQGNIPWQRPWNLTNLPKNYVSNKAYRGINNFLLVHSTFDSNYWLTYKQAKNLGGNVKKGEKGTIVVFWATGKRTKNDDDSDSNYRILRFYKIFNLEQCENVREIKNRETVEENTEIEENLDIEWFMKSLKHVPTINYGGNRAFYRPSEDLIQIPSLSSFEQSDEYYNTHFHEIAHSTGHSIRLDRLEKDAFFGNHEYSNEELVAEMSACFLCGMSGIETTKDNSVAYIQGWLKKLKSDPKCVVQAAGKAQKAVDYLLDIKHEN